jgi:predicted nucleic acid-binding protein
MPGYFDSSVVLSLLLGDQHAARAHDLWHAELDRVSSVLLEIECRTVLRRLPAPRLPETQRRIAEQRLTLALEEVTIKPVGDDIVAVVRDTQSLGGCRTLDAVHLATALYFRAAADADLWVHTFDLSMAELARRLGFRVSSV